ncbi:serine/Arginine-related protein 53-like isoform X1 [Onthophagus taurus]|uniref:serine/Arginine-related protein 53-like isoform X1 n=1 Tax=Onthophagus taurus TaxID=166361 RepID=UPI0039BDC065
MGKYSSDSDSDKKSTRRYKRSNSRRSSSPDSGDRYRRKKDKKTERHRSKSRDRYSRSRRSRSSSSHRSHKSFRHRRSNSRERSCHKSKDRHSSSRSKGRYSRRSRSRSYIKEYVSKPKHRASSSESSSSDSSKSSLRAPQKTKDKIVAVTQCTAILPKEEDEPIIMDERVLEEINEDGFEQKQFVSGEKKVPDNILIDLKKQTIKVPTVEPTEPDTIFHHNLFLNEEARLEKWVKELYSFRHKALLK